MNIEHFKKNLIEDVIELGRAKDSISTCQNGIDVVPTEHEPNMVFIYVVQTWYGLEKNELRPYCVHTTSTAYPPRPFHVSEKAKIRSYYVNSVLTTTDRRFLLWQRYIHTTLCKTTLRLLNVCSVLTRPMYVCSKF